MNANFFNVLVGFVVILIIYLIANELFLKKSPVEPSTKDQKPKDTSAPVPKKKRLIFNETFDIRKLQKTKLTDISALEEFYARIKDKKGSSTLAIDKVLNDTRVLCFIVIDKRQSSSSKPKIICTQFIRMVDANTCAMVFGAMIDLNDELYSQYSRRIYTRLTVEVFSAVCLNFSNVENYRALSCNGDICQNTTALPVYDQFGLEIVTYSSVNQQSRIKSVSEDVKDTKSDDKQLLNVPEFLYFQTSEMNINRLLNALQKSEKKAIAEKLVNEEIKNNETMDDIIIVNNDGSGILMDDEIDSDLYVNIFSDITVNYILLDWNIFHLSSINANSMVMNDFQLYLKYMKDVQRMSHFYVLRDKSACCFVIDDDFYLYSKNWASELLMLECILKKMVGGSVSVEKNVFLSFPMSGDLGYVSEMEILMMEVENVKRLSILENDLSVSSH